MKSNRFEAQITSWIKLLKVID